MITTVCNFATDGTPTYCYAKVGEAVGYRPDDLSLVTCQDIEVYDVKTGAPALDMRGRKLGFIEINAAEGWGIALDQGRPWDGPDVPTIRVEGHFEIRLKRRSGKAKTKS